MQFDPDSGGGFALRMRDTFRKCSFHWKPSSLLSSDVEDEILLNAHVIAPT